MTFVIFGLLCIVVIRQFPLYFTQSMKFGIFGNTAEYPHRDRIEILKLLLYAVNLLAVIYFSRVMTSATELICESFDARVFIERLRYVPIDPLRASATAFFLFLLLFAVEFAGRYSAAAADSDTLQLAVFFVMIFLCVGIMYCLNMGNKGLLIIPAVQAISGISRKAQKSVAIAVVGLLYILLDQDIASSFVALVPLDSYIDYYPADVKFKLHAERTILFSLNEVLFIAFIAVYIQLEIAKRNRIEELNSRLTESLRQLQVANVQLEEYAKKSEDLARLKERNRLAREIHDTIGHTLTGIEIGLKACLCIDPHDTAAVRDQTEKVYELARSGSKDVRLSLKELRPDALQRNTLLSALESLVQRMNECAKTNSYLLFEDALPELSPQQEELVYRIVQESMTNAVRHGEAREIEIRIGDDGTNLCMSISDNGKGAAVITEGFGLTNIRQRVEYFRGIVSVSSAPGKGFCLHILLPTTRRTAHD